MVEPTNAGGWWPSVYSPIKKAGERVAEWFAPKSDALMSKDHYRISVELPGVSPEDIDVSVHNHTLVVKGVKHSERQEEGDNYFFSEREYGAFQRSFRLPPDADAAAVNAAFRNGVLAIDVGKVGAEPSSITKIPVRTE